MIRVPEEVQAPDQSGVEVDEGGPGVAPERGAVVRQAPAGVLVVDPLLPEELAERDPPHLGHPEPLLGVPVQGAGVAADEDRPVRLPARRLAGLQRQGEGRPPSAGDLEQRDVGPLPPVLGAEE